LKLLFGLFVCPRSGRMVFPGQLPVGLFYLILGGVFA
jgi:hypothetical protein